MSCTDRKVPVRKKKTDAIQLKNQSFEIGANCLLMICSAQFAFADLCQGHCSFVGVVGWSGAVAEAYGERGSIVHPIAVQPSPGLRPPGPSTCCYHRTTGCGSGSSWKHRGSRWAPNTPLPNQGTGRITARLARPASLRLAPGTLATRWTYNNAPTALPWEGHH